jgi:hypothetical protein
VTNHGRPSLSFWQRISGRWLVAAGLLAAIIGTVLLSWAAAKPKAYASWQRECRELYEQAHTPQDTFKADWFIVQRGNGRSAVQDQTCGGLRLSGKL